MAQGSEKLVTGVATNALPMRTGVAMSVPLQAVLSNNSEATDPSTGDAGQHYVYVIEAGRAVRRTVEPGLSDDRYQQIRSGLAADEQVVVGPYRELRHLRNGDPLQVLVAGVVP